jgi:hypothetical protein
MTQELELAGAASVGGWLRWRKSHAIAPGTPCANCETPLQGPYCHSCGQLAESFHKSVWHLLVEAVESFFHFDGRFFRTVPRLAFAPGGLTRDYLDGKRASQIPPLRLFLVVLLLVFFVGSLTHSEKPKALQATPAELAALESGHATPVVATVQGAREVKAPTQDTKVDEGFRDFGRWLGPRLRRAVENPEQFKLIMEQWEHRVAVAMLPIAALLLTGLFAFQRRFYVFDHLVFSMHSLSFLGLLVTLTFALRPVVGPAAALPLLLAPVHLFAHMRGVYRTSVFGTLLRMALLFVGSSVAFVTLLAGMVFIGLNAMGPH